MCIKKILFFAGISACVCAAQAAFVVAHRGESILRPQNTCASFELAWENGVQYVEGDFHSTNGGEIVCVHVQKDFENFYKSSKKISSLSEYDVETCYFNNEKWSQYNGTPIPTLKTVFRLIPRDGVLVLEIKEMDGDFMKQVDSARKKNWLSQKNILFIAFDFKHLQNVKKFDKKYKCLWLYSVGKKGIDGEYSAAKVIKKIKDAGLDGVDVGGTEKLTPEYVKAFKDAGLTFCVWTVDDDKEAARLVKIGVDGITTNRATDMKAKLKLD